ncbi:hypothetical protein ACMX25_17100 [Caballeronia sp. 15715]|uniref:hypothetical protein n=1 Tax=Caballeronia sp. 15715 TaxID=3391030 RepID=UPI0039E36296
MLPLSITEQTTMACSSVVGLFLVRSAPIRRLCFGLTNKTKVNPGNGRDHDMEVNLLLSVFRMTGERQDAKNKIRSLKRLIRGLDKTV